MSHRFTTARARELGAELRRLREKSGYSSLELAKQLGWAASTVSRAETGVRGISEINLVHFAAKAGANWEQLNDLQAMWRESQIPGYWLTDRFSSLVFHESVAVSAVTYQPIAVPGILQTEDYATALTTRVVKDPDVCRHWVTARMERQRQLTGCTRVFFIHEQALRLPVVSDELMNEQMIKLLLLSEHPEIDIRVVPISSGAQAVMGSEIIMFRFTDACPLVCIDHGPMSLFLDDVEYVAAYDQQLKAMAEVALDRGQSREMLARLASEFDSSEDSRDGLHDLAEE